MKKIVIFLSLLIAACVIPMDADAQRNPGRDRESWMKEIQQFKNDFIAKKLDLNEEQREKFLPLYNSMDEEVRKVQEESEQLYRQTLNKKDEATDLEYEKAAEAQYELKGKENVIEMKYFNEYKTILSPQQLFKLKDAEKDFTRELMKQHRRRSR